LATLKTLKAAKVETTPALGAAAIVAAAVTVM
jgi:hypothetical protein